MKHKKKGKVGSSFDGFLAEQGILQECEEQAVKQILAGRIETGSTHQGGHGRPHENQP